MDNRKDGIGGGGDGPARSLARPVPARQRKRAKGGGAQRPPASRAQIGKAMVDLVLTGKRPVEELVDQGGVSQGEGGVAKGVGGEVGGRLHRGEKESSAERRTGCAGPGHLMGPAHAVIPPNPSCVEPEVRTGVQKGKRQAEPLGRPNRKRQTLSARLKSLVKADGGRHAKEIAEALVKRAKGEGKTANDAARIIFDRVDGPVVRKVDVQGEMHHRKTIVVRADGDLLRRAADNAQLADMDLPELLPSELEAEDAAFEELTEGSGSEE